MPVCVWSSISHGVVPEMHNASVLPVIVRPTGWQTIRLTDQVSSRPLHACAVCDGLSIAYLVKNCSLKWRTSRTECTHETWLNRLGCMSHANSLFFAASIFFFLFRCFMYVRTIFFNAVNLFRFVLWNRIHISRLSSVCTIFAIFFFCSIFRCIFLYIFFIIIHIFLIFFV